MRGWVRIYTGKAIQRKGLDHSANRLTLKLEKLMSSPLPEYTGQSNLTILQQPIPLLHSKI